MLLLNLILESILVFFKTTIVLKKIHSRRRHASTTFNIYAYTTFNIYNFLRLKMPLNMNS